MKSSELITVARMLRIALGYESREVRIGALLNSPYLDVRMMAKQLEAEGFLKLDKGTCDDRIILTQYSPPRGHQP